MSVMLTLILVVQMLSALAMIGLILISTAKVPTWVRPLAAVARAVCLVLQVGPTSCRAPLRCWRRSFLCAPCCWLISATSAQRHRAVCSKVLP